MTLVSDIAAGIREAAIATGGQPLVAIIDKPGAMTGPAWAPIPGLPTAYNVGVIDTMIKVKDATGTLTGETRRLLIMEAGVVVPAKGDTITVRGTAHQIDTVTTIAPGGVDLLYKCLLER